MHLAFVAALQPQSCTRFRTRALWRSETRRPYSSIATIRAAGVLVFALVFCSFIAAVPGSPLSPAMHPPKRQAPSGSRSESQSRLTSGIRPRPALASVSPLAVRWPFVGRRGEVVCGRLEVWRNGERVLAPHETYRADSLSRAAHFPQATLSGPACPVPQAQASQGGHDASGFGRSLPVSAPPTKPSQHNPTFPSQWV